MTQVVAIPCKDRIIVSSDGMMYDTDTKKYSYETSKIFRLTDSMCFMLTGWHLKDPSAFIAQIQTEIESRHLTDYASITSYIESRVGEKLWWDDDESRMYLLVAGYNGNEPCVNIISSDKATSGSVARYTLGSWHDEGVAHLYVAFGKKKYKKIQYSEAEIEATKIIKLAEKAMPDLVGGQQMIWHITRTRTDKKPKSYAQALRRKIKS